METTHLANTLNFSNISTGLNKSQVESPQRHGDVHLRISQYDHNKVPICADHLNQLHHYRWKDEPHLKKMDNTHHRKENSSKDILVVDTSSSSSDKKGHQDITFSGNHKEIEVKAVFPTKKEQKSPDLHKKFPEDHQ